MTPPERAPVEDAPLAVPPVESPRLWIADAPVHEVGGDVCGALAPATHVVHEWVSYTLHCAGATRLEVGSQS